VDWVIPLGYPDRNPRERKVTMARAMTMDDEVREKFQAVSIKMPPDLIAETRMAADANEESFARLVRRAIRQELASMKRRRGPRKVS
jgi:tartrate dehydratase alpha subunit/fumarate hydratase class I-like protein